MDSKTMNGKAINDEHMDVEDNETMNFNMDNRIMNTKNMDTKTMNVQTCIMCTRDVVPTELYYCSCCFKAIHISEFEQWQKERRQDMINYKTICCANENARYLPPYLDKILDCPACEFKTDNATNLVDHIYLTNHFLLNSKYHKSRVDFQAELKKEFLNYTQELSSIKMSIASLKIAKNNLEASIEELQEEYETTLSNSNAAIEIVNQPTILLKSIGFKPQSFVVMYNDRPCIFTASLIGKQLIIGYKNFSFDRDFSMKGCVMYNNNPIKLILLNFPYNCRRTVADEIDFVREKLDEYSIDLKINLCFM